MQKRVPKTLEELTQQNMISYVQHFFDIDDFKKIQNGKDGLEIIRKNPEHPRIKKFIKKVIGIFNCQVPAGKICALQFLKESVQTGSLIVVQAIEKSVLTTFGQIIEYRPNIRSMQRGATYLIKQFDKNASDDTIISLIKISSTLFRMVHQCVYVWGNFYFPTSPFERILKKLEKRFEFPKYPTEFKFFNEVKIANFKTNCQVLISKMSQRALNMSESNIELKRENSSSPRSNIKRTKQLSKVKASPKDQSDEQTELKISSKIRIAQPISKQLEQQVGEHPPSTQRSKRHKKHKPKKRQQGKSLNKQQTIKRQDQTNSRLKLKSKQLNNLNEVPLNTINEVSQKTTPQRTQRSASPNKIDQKSRTSFQNQIQELEESISSFQNKNNQSDGGRFSLGESSKQSQQISDIQYDYQRSPSPKLQNSLLDKKKQANTTHSKQNLNQLKTKKIASPVLLKEQKTEPQIKHLNVKQEKNLEKKRSKERIIIVQKIEAKEVKKQQQLNTKQIENTKLQTQQKDKNEIIQKTISRQKQQTNKKQTNKVNLEKSQKQKVQKNMPTYSAPLLNPAQSKKQPIQSQQISAYKLLKPQKLKNKKLNKPIMSASIYEDTYNESYEPIKETKKQQSSKNIKSQNIYSLKQTLQIQQISKSSEKQPKYQKTSKSIFNAVQLSQVKQIAFQQQENQKQKFQYFQPQLQSSSVVKQVQQSDNIYNQTKKQKKHKIDSSPQLKKTNNFSNSNTVSVPKQTIPQIITKKEDQRQQTMRNSNRRLRQFKQVNLFIESSKSSPDQSAVFYNTDDIQQKVKDHLIQQLHKIKSVILQSQSQNLNQTIVSLKEEILGERKQRSQFEAVECSTQTIKHKSKSKFERKKNHRLFEEGDIKDCIQNNNVVLNVDQSNLLIYNKRQLQARTNKLSAIQNRTQPESKRNSIQKKRASIEKEEFKPNTLLYALYKKKSLNC